MIEMCFFCSKELPVTFWIRRKHANQLEQLICICNRRKCNPNNVVYWTEFYDELTEYEYLIARIMES